ncbi:helix-turn-helix domain-containing protein [Actinophytocola gossypii]|uniref:GAF domain-containing protein n=1 Tax=Actinophytocola gossypii TaxID=2812003 RepID=A0ABT2JCY3_9PSEU|nr:GAF domain-containing protein [Actinophytocola gossypii]MCT2585717.1 GAF domain-containing protein [Actinophytocola gossypii]
MTTVSVRRLLDLLAEGASGERLAHVAVGAPELDGAVEVALRIRQTLTEHRRREAELTALFDTARDLSKLRDLDEVLSSIVRRARQLLGVDLSYLSLNDELAGTTYMRVTDGSVSSLLPNLRIGHGEGLGGLVAQTAHPYSSADYLADPRFAHTGPIDAAVSAERMVGILGVPLSLGTKVIGVLFAADRARREFTASEVALLSSLADHAAIAIDNAQLLAETRRANETISGHNAAMRRAEDAHDRLMELVLRGGDLVEVATEVASVLGVGIAGGIALFDDGGGELAAVGSTPPLPPVEAVASSRSSGRAVRAGEDWVCSVVAGQELLGSLVLTGRPSLEDADRRLFERAGVVAALLLLLRRSVAAAEDEVRGELLADLLTAPDRNPAGLLARGRRLGIDLDAPHAVLIASCDGVSRRRLAMACTRYATLVGLHADQVVLLVDGPASLAPKLATELSAAVDAPVTVGGAGPASGPVALAAAAAEAGRCVRALLALGRAGSGAALPELGFVGQLIGDRTDLAGYVRSVLGPVLDYDERRGTDLVGTLYAYFDSGGNLTRAKDRLHVHVNTVVQRLERISSLLGGDWQAPERALEVQVALRLYRLGG